jgi:hypothetical protein
MNAEVGSVSGKAGRPVSGVGRAMRAVFRGMDIVADNW